MKKSTITIFLIIFSLATFAQKRFPHFNYVSVGGDTITNTTLIGKSTIIIVGHISCPGVLLLVKDIQKAAFDTIQTILLLENTKEQILAFNSFDTSDIWNQQRQAFKIEPVKFPIVTFCNKQRLKKLENGTILIQNQCHKLKLKYRALEAPKIYIINNEGHIIRKQIGWYLNLPDPKKTINELFRI